MAEEKILAKLGPFTGVDAKTSVRYLEDGKSPSPPPNSYNTASNVISGAFFPEKGRVALFTPGAGAVLPLTGLTNFVLSSGATNYIFTAGPPVTSSNGASVYSWNGTTSTNLPFPSLVQSPLSTTQLTRFVQYQKWLFMSNGGAGLAGNPLPPIKVNGAGVISRWQLSSPANLTAVAGFAGHVTIGGAVHVGDTVNVTTNGFLASYTVVGGDTFSSIATNTAAAINALNRSEITASASGAVITVVDTSPPLTLTSNVTGAGATVTALTSLAGNLVGVYYYRFTYSNADQESSPSGVSAATTYNATTTGFGGANVPLSSDTTVTTINLYRLGGTSGQWTFVNSVPNTATNASSFVNISDNTADLSLSGQNLILHRDQPAQFTDIALHKDRIWGFGLPQGGVAPGANLQVANADLWYSNFKEPWGWNYADQVLPVGEADGGDIAVALAPIGSILICFKTRTTWAVYGDAPGDFLIRPLFNIGCVGIGSVVVGAGVVTWASVQRRIYRFDGNTLEYIGEPLQPYIDANITTTQLAASVGWYYNNTYYLSIPGAGIILAYDTIHKEWRILNFASVSVVYNDSENSQVVAASLSTLRFDTWHAGFGDLGGNMTSTYTSKIYNDPPDRIKQYRHLEVISPVVANQSYPMTITVTTDPGQTANQHSFIVSHDAAGGSRTYSLPPSLTGREVQLTITYTGQSGAELTQLLLSGWTKRPATVMTE